MKNNQKGFAPILLILLIVVLIGGGAYLYTQNSPKEKEESSLSVTTEESNQKTEEILQKETDIRSSITVLSPNGGETWLSGQSQKITWKYSNLIGYVLVSLRYQDGKLCNIAQVPVSQLSYTFSSSIGQDCTINPASKIQNGSYKIYLYASNHEDKNSEGDSGIFDESDNYFNILLSDINQINDNKNIPTNQEITITSIKPNDLVKLPITIEGYLNGKGWSANEGEIGFVEVLDAYGKSISNKEIVKTTTDWMKYPTYFEAIVGNRQMMSSLQTNTGTVKITSNGVKDGEQIKSISIPVRFK